jgi:hypothetical protein
MMATIFSSVTRQGATEPFELQVARGQIQGHTNFCQFGFNSAVGTSYETVWIEGGTYAFPAAAAVMKISSSSATDDKDSTGAHTVLIEGVDASYNLISEVVTLEGQAPQNTTNSYLRVNKLTILTAGSGGTSAGAIYAGTGDVTDGVPAVVVNRTGVNSNESESAFYTVPDGYTAYITRWTMSSANTEGNASTQFALRVRPYGGVFGFKALYYIPGNGIYECEAFYPVGIPGKSDIEVRAAASAGSAFASTQLQILLVKEGP